MRTAAIVILILQAHAMAGELVQERPFLIGPTPASTVELFEPFEPGENAPQAATLEAVELQLVAAYQTSGTITALGRQGLIPGGACITWEPLVLTANVLGEALNAVAVPAPLSFCNLTQLGQGQSEWSGPLTSEANAASSMAASAGFDDAVIAVELIGLAQWSTSHGAPARLQVNASNYGGIVRLVYHFAVGCADVNGDGIVNVSDLVAVIMAWGSDDAEADVDGNGIVDVLDLIAIINEWKQPADCATP